MAKADQDYVLKLGHTGAPTHHYQKICTMFADEVAKKTDGHVKIQVYPADQLGKQLEAVEGCMLGTQDMVLTSDTVLSNWVPDMGHSESALPVQRRTGKFAKCWTAPSVKS